MTDYTMLVKQAEELLKDCPWEITGYANLSALLYDSLEDVNWAGFYLIRDDELVLGPFQGKIACDSASESEIVLPIHKDGKIRGVLDIDSTKKGRFSQEDEAGLYRIVQLIEAK